jgi:glutamate dehydrogenase/leucine dehydrogenase
MELGGSNIRPEATGYGAVYFGENILRDMGETYTVGERGPLGSNALGREAWGQMLSGG